MSSSQRAGCQTIRAAAAFCGGRSGVGGGNGGRGRGFGSCDGVLWALPRRRTANSTRLGEVCKHDGLWRTSQGPLFALAEQRRPLCSLASLNYCLHVNTKLHKQDSGRGKKKVSEKKQKQNQNIHIQGHPYLSATVCQPFLPQPRFVLNRKFIAFFCVFVSLHCT